jgi:energy-coupling factor transport system ATP-binding protein
MQGTPYQRHALKDVSLTFAPGEFAAVIGHTGSGKSTLIQHLNGLIKPTSGFVKIGEVDINQKGPQSRLAKQRVGMVFQYPEHQLFEETVEEDVAFGPKNLGLDFETTAERVRRSIEFVGLNFDEVRGRSPFRLSGGQMRRVAIAGVLALEPEYLILDEPTAGLDPQGRDEILSQIRKLHIDTGMAVILVSHNMEEVARLAKRIVVMNKGEVRYDGTASDLFNTHGDELPSYGVNLPEVVKLLRTLKAKGLNVDTSALTPEAGAKAIQTALRRAKC